MFNIFKHPPKEAACPSRRFRDCEDKPRRVKARFFSFITISTGLFYLVWAVFSANREHTVPAALFLLAEFACWGLFTLATVGLWRLRFKPLEGLPGDGRFSVDIFIPTCSEPLQYLKATLRAASRIEYAGVVNRYVLDDAGRPEVEVLARTFGFHYLSRPRSRQPSLNAKAGNLNFGLRQTHGDLVLVLDADQVAQPNMLNTLVGYMGFANVAFVQSKQSYLTQEGDPFYNKS